MPTPLLATKLIPHPLNRILAVPMGLALGWLGYALWAERRARAVETVPGTARRQLRHTAAD